MSESATVTLDEVIATAAQITKNPTARALTLVPVAKIAAMAATVTCLDDIAVLASKLLVATPEQQDTLRAELAAALAALNYLSLQTRETNDERAS